MIEHRVNVFAGANHHLKRQAVNEVARAVRNGALTSGPCAVCGEPLTHGHHEDYAKPLEVVWLCPLHHSWRHAYGHSVEEMRDEAAT